MWEVPHLILMRWYPCLLRLLKLLQEAKTYTKGCKTVFHQTANVHVLSNNNKSSIHRWISSNCKDLLLYLNIMSLKCLASLHSLKARLCIKTLSRSVELTHSAIWRKMQIDITILKCIRDQNTGNSFLLKLLEQQLRVCLITRITNQQA